MISMISMIYKLPKRGADFLAVIAMRFGNGLLSEAELSIISKT